MSDRFVIDCSGRKIPVGDKQFAAKCWVGNTSDFLAANGAHIIASAVEWRPVPRVHITMPIYRSGDGFQETLYSLLAQNWNVPNEVEILLYVNQPEGPIEELTRASLRSLGINPGESQNMGDLGLFDIAPNSDKQSPLVRILFEKLPNGLASVYQRSFATLVARINRSVERLELSTKAEKVTALNEIMTNTIFAVVDDDLRFNDTDAFSGAIKQVEAGKSLVLGVVTLDSVQSGYAKFDSIVLTLMNLFLEIKQSLGTSVLTPRAAAVKDLFHLPSIDPSIPYADQIWFAQATVDKKKILVPASTTLVAEQYPSNAEMAMRLGQYLETGEPRGALEIFKNLLKDCSQIQSEQEYTSVFLSDLLTVLEARDFGRLDKTIGTYHPECVGSGKS